MLKFVKFTDCTFYICLNGIIKVALYLPKLICNISFKTENPYITHKNLPVFKTHMLYEKLHNPNLYFQYSVIGIQ